MRVLHVIAGLGSSTGGPAVIAVELSAALRSAGVDSVIFSTDQSGPASARSYRPAREEDLPPRAREIEIRLFPTRHPRRLAFSPELYAALRRETRHYDVVHIHSLFLFPQFAAFRHAKKAGVPYVISQHGALDPHLRSRGRVRKKATHLVWQKRMLNGAGALHVGSEEEARGIADVVPRVPRVQAPFGVASGDYEELPSGDSFRGNHLGGFEGPIVMNVGRLAWKKGLDILIRAFALVAADAPQAKLVLAGPDEDGVRPLLMQLAQRERVADRVVFTGMLRGAEIRAALAAADIWALPSRAEAFPMAVLEALAAGKPIVISPAVNTAPDIAEAEAGIVCAAEPDAFAREIVTLLRDDERRAQLARNARAFARRFDWDAIAPRWIDLYTELATSR
jgi:glycosyltransferase involved in cell wall biosynthesis